MHSLVNFYISKMYYHGRQLESIEDVLKFRIRTSFISREGAAIVNMTRLLTAFYRNRAHSFGGPSSVLGFFSAIPRIVFECYSTYCFLVLFHVLFWVLFYVLFFNLPNFFQAWKIFQHKKIDTATIWGAIFWVA